MTADAYKVRVRAELDKPLDPARVKQRQGAGRRSLDYLETHDVIRHANRIFGFGAWGFTTELACLGEEPISKDGKQGFRVGYRATVTLTVSGCETTCGVGYGDAVEYVGSRITPHELASKEAESDGLKRALKNYGDQFGLSLYAKGGVVSQPAPTPAASVPHTAAQTAPAAFVAPTGDAASEPATGERKERLRAVAGRAISAGLITSVQLDSAMTKLTGQQFEAGMLTLSRKDCADLTGRLERLEERAKANAKEKVA